MHTSSSCYKRYIINHKSANICMRNSISMKLQELEIIKENKQKWKITPRSHPLPIRFKEKWQNLFLDSQAFSWIFSLAMCHFGILWLPPHSTIYVIYIILNMQAFCSSNKIIPRTSLWITWTLAVMNLVTLTPST